MTEDGTSGFFSRIKLHSNPDAQPGSVVTCGSARFTLLTSRLVRMEWAPAKAFENQATFAFPHRFAQPPAFSCQEDNTGLQIQTDHLNLRYTKDGSSFNASNLVITFFLNGQAVEWRPGMVNATNLRGTCRTLDQCPDATSLQEGLLSRAGWAVFDDSGTVVWDSDGQWVEARPAENEQDWYFFGYGHDYKAALADYVRFGGPIPLVPRYVLGAWWSRFWPYRAEDLKQLVKEFDDHALPLDVLVVDMDWHTPDAWTGYTWNRKLFPDPVTFLRWVHEQDLHVTLNLHPAQGVQKHEEAYPQFAALLGHDTGNGESIPFAPASKAFMQHYFELLHHPLEDQGVDFWWVDWQQGDASTLKGLDPLPWLNHLHFLDSTRRNTRPMLYSRWGGLGNHRYPIGFSGDTYATWEALHFEVYFTPTAANVAYGWWSHDIGGHFGATDPELYARWVQFGAVSPCLRLHSTNDPLAERRPWGFSEPVYEAAKAAFQLRYQLLPYLYSAARAASEKGLSLCYPMYYEYPEADDAYVAREQYFLGDQLLAAPISRPADPTTGLAAYDVWIPEGEWIDYTSLETFVGPRWVRRYGDLKCIPIFVRSGAILPMAPTHVRRTKDADGSELVLTVFPGASGHCQLYEDDGATEKYKQEEYEITPIESNWRDVKTFVLHIGAAEGLCPALPERRTLEIRLRGVSQPQAITANGQVISDWIFLPDSQTLSLSLPDTDRRSALSIEVAFASSPNGRETKKGADVALDRPIVHFLDYTTPEDARQQFGTVVVARPADDSPFDLEVKWELHRGAQVIASPPQLLKGCQTDQIIQCPFADNGDSASAYWRVSTTVFWQGQIFHDEYQSQVVRPSLNVWKTRVYNPVEKPNDLKRLLAGNGLDDGEWSVHSIQVAKGLLNLKQPFGLVLLEQERPRILGGEPLEACLQATLFSPAVQEAVLYVQNVGTTECYCNSIQLPVIEAIAHAALQPMFPSWMPPAKTYYAINLRQGANHLVLVSRPTEASGWWGVGATLFDPSGNVLTDVVSV
ncbi:MAG TPA: TIM-barrel domain-containing protein [Aggregatilineales bacterium]|nr:TIM-barrel domain-containing protein [Aggregatilineales bacterium]